MQRGKESKPHIGIYGRRNNGKSSLINLLAGQNVAIVSDFAGTTTDPVKKSFEITGFGPVILVDTAGIDDSGELGEKRVGKTLETINQVDLAILVVAGNTWGDYEERLIEEFSTSDTPFLVIHNKSDLTPASEEFKRVVGSKPHRGFAEISCLWPNNVDTLVEMIKGAIPESSYQVPTLLGDLISYGDVVLLITPIDVEAPAGRLILPQVQAIRDVLDNDAVAIVLKEREVDDFLRKTRIKPALAVTDSQIFSKADASIPRDIPLTSFSILLARMKGDFASYLKGTPKISQLKNGDRVLLLESCSHHVSCDDIGRTKIPRWLSNFTGKQLEYDVVAGLSSLPRSITDYALVIQCGGCMITRKQLINRIRPAVEAGIPVTNYGMAIAYVQGIYQRAIAPFAPASPTSYL
ncbi:MAG TPA: [FeFe] hydrogenase H-cluster maturation GTPase HydF [Tenuifilaceae bacterium]|jgi:[FeFe] hydrogenase H-cluster maturation GTPase HydF|nr:[FeFe] hydrogenase H-cluster maturation GTPase HydF [Bacteroidales bacterium]HNT41154.1 [FeFe] hydrogenase H-cluster maturation GTPase HydF [Tenuifilaceae bacterium]MBP8643289.1 [FeFe] hydrogenase H-cluster maturation GTPase HydF [Bacteroidales bacterium]HNY08518.1 [FeFe] hydrogenase H-cluster maturation GTPase HydF [Tenuifilaceae bacterium]HOA10190.1 [FeFe] hydrogenase H-cluster maturation GTPase HydF [Tenuifilaceae bacterium]